ncbi:hypothetical protein AAG570_013359 [Ranatra chinensis]|uniref:YDG domain-containing protein n=1 Tax=Ranatra chinensis TaxID=642074 RepID=A0ABD0YBY2_9HEMI
MLSLPRLRVRKNKENFANETSENYQCNTYGSINGVKVGTEWLTRKECSGSGVHRPTVSAIHAGPEGAYSIIISAKCEVKDEGCCIIYSGSNGRTKNDSELGHCNFSLVLSVRSKLPVRVVRSFRLKSPYAPEAGYRYDGVYWVKKWWEDRTDGRMRYRFKMLRLDGQDPPSWRVGCLTSLTERHNSDSEEPRILTSRHFRIQTDPRPVQHPTLNEDVKPNVKAERNTPLFALTGEPPPSLPSEISLIDLQEGQPNPKSEHPRQEFRNCFVDVQNLSDSPPGTPEPKDDWETSTAPSPPPDTCVYEEENKVKVDIHTTSYPEEEQSEEVEQPHPDCVTILVQPEKERPSLPVIHEIVSFAEELSECGLSDNEEEQEIPIQFPQNQIAEQFPEGNYIILNNLSAVPESEWTDDTCEIPTITADPLSQNEETPLDNFQPADRKAVATPEKEEMEDKEINGLKHNCFFDISLRDIAKMVSDLEGCPCLWTEKQRMSSCYTKRHSFLPPLVIHYLKNIVKMAEAEENTKPQIIGSKVNSASEELQDVELVVSNSPYPLSEQHTLIPSTSLPSLPPPAPPITTFCTIATNTEHSPTSHSIGTNTRILNVTSTSSMTNAKEIVSTSDKAVGTNVDLVAKQTQTELTNHTWKACTGELTARGVEKEENRKRKAEPSSQDEPLTNGDSTNEQHPKKAKPRASVECTGGEFDISLEGSSYANFEEEWAQPHSYKVQVVKSFDQICEELCKTLPDNGERQRKKSVASKHNINNHIPLKAAQKQHTTRKVRRRQVGFTGFTESQHRLSKVRTSMMYGFYIDNCNFRGWSQGSSDGSFIAGSHLNFDF